MGGQKSWKPLQVMNDTSRASGNAIMNNDFRAFARIFHLPHHIGTFEANTTLQTREDLEGVFSPVSKRFAILRTTRLVRRCIAAQRKARGLINAAHTTRVLSGSCQVGETSSVFSVLRLLGPRWRCISWQYAFADELKPSEALIPCRMAPQRETPWGQQRLHAPFENTP